MKWLWNILYYALLTIQTSLGNENLFVWNRTLESFENLDGKIWTNDMLMPTEKSYQSLENKTVKVVAHDMYPYIFLEDTHLGGFLGDMWQIIEHVLKFKSDILFLKDYDQGRDMITNYEKDIFLASVVYTNRTRNMYFSHQYFNNWYYVYFRMPQGKPKEFLHFTVLSRRLWVYIFVTFSIMSVCLWLSCQVLKIMAPNSEVLWSLPTFFMGVLSPFCNTGYNLQLKSFTGRFLIFVALLFGTFCGYFLNAGLVANLAILDIPMPFSNMEEISDKKTFSLCLRNITFVYDTFTTENHTIYPQWQEIVNSKNCPSDMNYFPSITKALCLHNVAVLENRIILNLALKNLPCEVMKLPARYFFTGNYIVFSKKFEDFKLITLVMLKIKSTGIAKKLELPFVIEDTNTVVTSTKVSSITFDHIRGIIYMYSGMVLVSLCILFIEIIIHKLYCKQYVVKRGNNITENRQHFVYHD